MGNQRTSGLTKRGGVWHVDKCVRGVRLCESTGTGDVQQAEEYLAKRLTELREAKLYGLRDARTFRVGRDASTCRTTSDKKRIKDDAMHLRQLDPFIGRLELKQVHMGSLQAFIAQAAAGRRQDQDREYSLGVVRRVLNLAASEWMDEQGHDLAGDSTEDQAVSRHGCPVSISTHGRGAGAAVSGATGSSRAYGAL